MRAFLLRGSQMAIDVGVLAIAFFLAFVLRFDWDIPFDMFRRLVLTFPYVIAFQFVVLLVFSVHRFSWRYFGLREAVRIGAAVALTAVVLLGLRIGLAPTVRAGNFTARFLLLPIGVIAIDGVLAFVGLSGVRSLRRMAGERSDARMLVRADRKTRTLLVGAGDAGLQVAKQLERRPDLGVSPVGYVDDERTKVGTMLHGIPVLGTTEDLVRLCADHEVSQVLITIAAASGPQIRRITELCESAGIEVKTVPALAELVDGAVELSTIRSVAIEDLLRRAPVALDEAAIGEAVRGRVVMVTGAGGSIGSEICRQVSRFEPARLVLYEIAESHLFHIHRELVARHPGLEVVPLVGDVRDAGLVDATFARHTPDLVFHAAAYKHVPMMEWNPVQAITNNVRGTRVVAEAALRHEAGAFVLISTDKAVRPSSVMGASKRAAELVVRGLPPSNSTRFCCVRFGNVLGSEGSVVPIFKEQIARGGPVTVTHPDMKRYFMTIPEACQLVMQSAAMAEGGEVFILDMGEPVKIVDLARDLIRLSGLRPEADIDIEFVGVRPGEKLFEELADVRLGPTAHASIFVEVDSAVPDDDTRDHIAEIEAAAARAEVTRIRAELGRLCPSLVDPGSAGVDVDREDGGHVDVEHGEDSLQALAVRVEADHARGA